MVVKVSFLFVSLFVGGATAEEVTWYTEGELVPLLYGGLKSTKTQLPMGSYTLPICRPKLEIQKQKMNLGQALSGDRIETSPYADIRMKQDLYCQSLCVSDLGLASPESAFYRAIEEQYFMQLMLDGLPAASKFEDDAIIMTRYWAGLPVGFSNGDENFMVNNHFNLEIVYTSSGEPGYTNKYRVIRFIVEPFSIAHDFEDSSGDVRFRDYPASLCGSEGKSRHTNYDMVTAPGRRPKEASSKTLFTYDVIWIEESTEEKDRWDVYTTMDNAIPAFIHWYSIANSFFYAMSLFGLVAVILLRNVRDSIDEEDTELGVEETRESLYDKGYALVHIDIFHPPDHCSLLLAVFSGTGAQLLATFLITLTAAFTGQLHSSARGRLALCALLSFKICGLVNGFVTVQVMKLFQAGNNWKVGATTATLFLPSITFVLFLCQQAIAAANGSTLAANASVFAELMVLWLFLLVPLTYIGAYLGSTMSLVNLPTSPRSLLIGLLTYRSIRNGDRLTKGLCVLFCLLFNFSWLAIGLLWALRSCLVKCGLWRPDFNMVGVLLTGGVVCFGSISVENYYIMSSMWMRYYYETYGFLVIVASIFFWTCAMVSALFNYVSITVEGCHCWWWQFLCSGAAGIWCGVYALFYGAELELSSFSSFLLYSGFMAWVSLAVFLMTGFVGLLSSFGFVKLLFSIAAAGKTLIKEEQEGISLQEARSEGQSDSSATEQLPADSSACMAVDATLT